MHGSLRALMLCAPLLIACAAEPDAAPGSPPDSMVEENAAPPRDSSIGWTIPPAPDLSIGEQAAGDAYDLFGVRDAAVLPDGRVAIANAGSGEIRLFASDATHLLSMGGAGEGPGEFRSLRAIESWTGDSILAWDTRQQRISIFDRDGNHGRTFRVPQFNDRFSLEFLGATPDGRLFLRAGFPRRDDEPYKGMFRPDQRYILVDGEGRTTADLGPHPGTEGFLVASGGMESFFEHPHAKSTWSAVWGDQLIISPNDTYELRVFDVDGGLVEVVRMDHEAPRPTRDDMEAWFDVFTANDTPDERARFRETFEALPLLESFPAFDAILVDGLEHVWVRDFDRPGDDRAAWVVFDPDGRVLGRIETPSGLEIYEIGADYLLGRARGPLNVESVQLWSLTR